jgi:hypothetical protein
MISHLGELGITAERLSAFNQIIEKSFNVQKTLTFQSLNLCDSSKKRQKGSFFVSSNEEKLNRKNLRRETL